MPPLLAAPRWSGIESGGDLLILNLAFEIGFGVAVMFNYYPPKNAACLLFRCGNGREFTIVWQFR